MNCVPTSIFSLQQVLDKKLANKELNDALVLIRQTIECVIDEPLCTARAFGTKFLDDYCQKIGAFTLQSHRNDVAGSTKKTRVYLVTKLQKSGGHTRVLEDLIRSSPQGIGHVVLSTELVGKSDRAAIEKNMRGHDVTFEWNDDPSSLQKLLWIQKRLLKIAPESVWLFNHHQDSVVVAAAQPQQGYKTYFYHHGDHHLCLGVFLSWANHIDPLPMGFHHCRTALGFSQNIYLPLWMKDGGVRHAPPAFMQAGHVTTCTAARSNKVEVPYFISYIAMIPEIIKATGGRHIHIGKLTPWALWKIRRALKKENIDSARFVYTPWEPSIWQALHKHGVDLYIASFPYGGARTLIEAMGAGTPVIVHDHYATRMLSCIDVVYPEAFTWRDPGDLYAFLKGLLVPFLEEQSRAARVFFTKHHDAELFQNLDMDKLPPISAPHLKPHVPNMLQWGLDVTRQMTLFGLIWRFFYRHRRKLKKFL